MMSNLVSLLLVGLCCLFVLFNVDSCDGKSMKWFTTGKPRLQRIKRSVSAGMPMKTVGRCSEDEVRSNGSHCMALLYRTNDEKQVKSCRSKVPSFVTCTRTFFTKCLTGLIDDDSIKMTLEGVELGITSSPVVTLYCDDGSVERKAPSALEQFCLPALQTDYVRCSKQFHQVFDANRANESLCRLFQETNTCLLKSLSTNCNLPIVTSAVNQEKAALQKRPNPFCHKEKEEEEEEGTSKPSSGHKPGEGGDTDEEDEENKTPHPTGAEGTTTIANTGSKPIKNNDDKESNSLLLESSASLLSSLALLTTLLFL